jgi:hypothetical protein
MCNVLLSRAGLDRTAKSSGYRFLKSQQHGDPFLTGLPVTGSFEEKLHRFCSRYCSMRANKGEIKKHGNGALSLPR